VIQRSLYDYAQGAFDNTFPEFVVDAIYQHYREAIALEEVGIVHHFLE